MRSLVVAVAAAPLALALLTTAARARSPAPTPTAPTAPTAPAPATTAAAAPSLAERFGPREYVSGSRVVPVTARRDMLALRLLDASLDADGAAGLVEDAAARLVPEARVASAKLLRHARPTSPLRGAGEEALALVELAAPVTRAELVALGGAVDGGGRARSYPALARMRGRAFATEELVVTARPGRLAAVLPQVLASTGGSVVRYSSIPDTALVAVGAPVAFDAVEASRRVRTSGSGAVDGLVSAEPNLVRELALRAVTPNDPAFGDQWHLARQSGGDIPGTGEIFADDAWETTLGDPSVLIAVFDTGIDVDHPDLAPNVRTDVMFDSAGADDDPRPECSGSFDGRDVTSSCPDDAPFRESHGTSVSGVVAAVGDNGIDVSGVCPRCSLLPVRLLGDDAGTGLTIAEAFRRAVERGAHAINNSWGPGFSLFFPLSQSERDAFAFARTAGRDGKGTVILFAAGNETSDVAGDAYASHPYVIAVAAVTNIDDWAFYSNFGNPLDVAAPSQGLPEDQDGIPEDDFGIVTTDVSGDDGYDADDVNFGFGGTSAASPVTAGLVGLVLSANPELTAEQVRLVLTSSADKIRADKIDWLGLIGQDIEEIFDYDDAGHSIGFGYGRINAAAAVAQALAFAGRTTGGACDAAGCSFCSSGTFSDAESGVGACLDRCTGQSDCLDGSVCTPYGACALPQETHAQFLDPCTADCAFCTPTLDTEFLGVEICTIECGSDDDCPDGFDCRLTDVDGPSICGVGDKGAGAPADFFNCFAPQIGTSLVAVTGEGRELCADVCFGAGPGACPYGFACGAADCECTAGGNFGCFEFTCAADDNPLNFDQNDFVFPVCLPLPGHADDCEKDIDCQLGDYCRAGRCALDDRGGCDICGGCDSDDDCAGRGICAGLDPENGDAIGECLWACGDSDPCPGDSVCRTIDARFGDIEVCISPRGGSAPADRCDSEYACSVACREDVPCPAGQVCDGGACVAADPDGPDVPGVSGGGCACASTGSADIAFGALAIALVGARRRRRRCKPG